METLTEYRHRAIAENDRRCMKRIDAARGILASLHAEKRRQAAVRQAHDPALMPLVADEADRLAILANAAKEDEAVAAIETERRQIKAALKSAKSKTAVREALGMFADKKDRALLGLLSGSRITK